MEKSLHFSLLQVLIVSFLILLLIHIATGVTLHPSKPLILAWGDNTYQQVDGESNNNYLNPKTLSNLPDGLEFQDIAPGVFHTLALSKDGRVYCWGASYYGECGISDYGRTIKDPIEITGFPSGLDVVSVYPAYDASIFLMSDGSLYGTGGSWAFSGSGGGDTPSKINFNEPVKVTQFVGDSKIKIALALDDQGRVWGWSAETVPILLTSGISTRFIKISLMYEQYNFDAVFLSEEGDVWTYKGDDQLSSGTVSKDSSLSASMSPNTQFCLGDDFMAVFDGQDIRMRGDNSQGQLGRNNIPSSSQFVSPDLPFSFSPSNVECGNYMTFSLGSEGELFAWGDSRYMGIGSSSSPSNIPTRVLPDHVRFLDVKTRHKTTFALADISIELDIQRSSSGILYPEDEFELVLNKDTNLEYFGSSARISFESPSAKLRESFEVDLLDDSPKITLPKDDELLKEPLNMIVSPLDLDQFLSIPLNNAFFNIAVDTLTGRWIKSEKPIPIQINTNIDLSSFELTLHPYSAGNLYALDLTSKDSVAWPQNMDWSSEDKYYITMRNKDLNIRQESNAFRIDTEKRLENLQLSLENGNNITAKWSTQGFIEYVSIQVYEEEKDIPFFTMSSVENKGELVIALSEFEIQDFEGETFQIRVVSEQYKLSTEKSITVQTDKEDSQNSSGASSLRIHLSLLFLSIFLIF
eukprot:gb/GECH01001470.1/.p1 GENE.gb/GECH01001470.1/~~gb/GECH01001470.1/.p1  ORF type:complete len:693 (+),score=135.91 gb/GECH01001470.1/:1-2079(+)